MLGIPTVATDLNTVLVIMEGKPNLKAYVNKDRVHREKCEDPTSIFNGHNYVSGSVLTIVPGHTTAPATGIGNMDTSWCQALSFAPRSVPRLWSTWRWRKR